MHDRHRMRFWTVTIHIFPDPFVGTSTASVMVSAIVFDIERLREDCKVERC